MDVDAPDAGSSPAPSPEPSPPPSVSDRLAALTAVERAEWRKTGQLPGTTAPSAESSPAAAADSAPAAPDDQAPSSEESEDESSAPAADQPPDTNAPRRRKPANARFQELLADRARERQLREAAERRIRELESSIPAPRARLPDAPAASSPAAPESPPDVNTFEDYSEYTKALTAYEVRRALAAERDRVAQEQAARQQQAETARLVQSWETRKAAARQKYPDFDQVALETPTAIPAGSLIDAWILESDDGADVLYQLQKRPPELQRILSLPPLQQARALVQLGEAVNGTEAPARRTNSHAPEPPPTLQTRGTPPDEVSQAIKHRDVAAYIAAANRRDLAARK